MLCCGRRHQYGPLIVSKVKSVHSQVRSVIRLIWPPVSLKHLVIRVHSWRVIMNVDHSTVPIHIQHPNDALTVELNEVNVDGLVHPVCKAGLNRPFPQPKRLVLLPRQHPIAGQQMILWLKVFVKGQRSCPTLLSRMAEKSHSSRHSRKWSQFSPTPAVLSSSHKLRSPHLSYFIWRILNKQGSSPHLRLGQTPQASAPL